MVRVNIKSGTYTPFGGLYFANKAFSSLSIGKIINETLGTRSSTYNGYQWDEIVSALFDVYLSGGDYVEDVNRRVCHLRESPSARIPTSHTIGGAIKELVCSNTEYKSGLNTKKGLLKSTKKKSPVNLAIYRTLAERGALSLVMS